MKTYSWSLLMLFSSITMISLTGCGGDSQPTSMTEGVELSEIEAYEEAVRKMESDDAGGMDEAGVP
jgi:hypothetical protein